MTPTRDHMNDLWREMLSWPVPARIAFASQLMHSAMDDVGSTLIDGGHYDTVAMTNVYVIAGRGDGARRLRDAVTAMLSTIDGRRSVVRAGPDETPLTAAARGTPQFVGEVVPGDQP